MDDRYDFHSLGSIESVLFSARRVFWVKMRLECAFYDFRKTFANWCESYKVCILWQLGESSIRWDNVSGADDSGVLGATFKSELDQQDLTHGHQSA